MGATDVQFGANILVLVGAVAYFTRLAVDLVRMYRVVPLGLVILMLVIGGPLIALLFYLTGDPSRTVQALTQSTVAGVILGGWAGAAGAIAGNAAGGKANPTSPPATEPPAPKPGGV